MASGAPALAPPDLRVAPDGWLAGVERIPTRRTRPLDTPTPLAVVWHWTASGARDDRGDRDSRALAQWIADPQSDAKASWHLVVDRTGTVIQSAPLTVGTWHVGKPGFVQGRDAKNVNGCTVGIELENLGELKRAGDGLEAWPFDGRRDVALARGTKLGDGRWWDTYTAEQEAAGEALVRAIRDRFALPRSAFAYAHATFDAPRKIDPGPLWMDVILPRILDRVFAPGAP